MVITLVVALTLIVACGTSAVLGWTGRRVARRRTRSSELLRDPLTGLANRAVLIERLDQALARAARNGDTVAVLVLGVDRLTAINHRLGHEWGDRVLTATAARIQAQARLEDTVGRVDGDQFAVLLEEVTDANGAARVAERVVRSFLAPLDLGADKLAVSVSVGVAVSGEGSTSQDLLRDASLATQRAKEKGRARFELFDAELGRQAVGRLRLEARMRDALADGELVVHYLPEILLHTGEVVGAEALVRWQHPTLGLLQPDQFVAVAEETGLIVPMGGWVLAEACRFVAGLERRGLVDAGFRLSVNVSVHQLRDGLHFAEHVADVLAVAGLDPHRLALEITETYKELEPLAPVLERLRRMGVAIALDDFGTGYSSLVRLRSLPVDILKIDRRFVQSVEEPVNRAIVRSVIELARVGDLDVTAEGIETSAQLEVVRGAGCRRGQGFLFSRPVAGRHLEQALAAGAACGESGIGPVQPLVSVGDQVALARR